MIQCCLPQFLFKSSKNYCTSYIFIYFIFDFFFSSFHVGENFLINQIKMNLSRQMNGRNARTKKKSWKAKQKKTNSSSNTKKKYLKNIYNNVYIMFCSVLVKFSNICTIMFSFFIFHSYLNKNIFFFIFESLTLTAAAWVFLLWLRKYFLFQNTKKKTFIFSKIFFSIYCMLSFL